MKILGVTACPTGIAHTYMAAEAIEKAAKAKGYEVKVETRGSVGVENGLTDEDIANADVIVLACDMTTPTDRFIGKKLISVGVAEAIKHASEIIDLGQDVEAFDGTVKQTKLGGSKEKEDKKGLFGFLKK